MSILNILKKLNSRDTQLIPQFPKLTKTFKFVSLIVGLTFIALLTHQILAADPTPNTSAAIQKYEDKQAAIDKGNNQESWMNESIMSNTMSLNTAIAGTIPNAVLQGKTTSWIPGGMLGFTNQSIAYLYNPPASGVQYIANTVNNFLGKPAYAANGYQGLQGILPMWKSFRNAVYILFSIFFVAIGIAIMLRVKVSQQAVVTIQSAIPQLITSLILVTFSYAIAGLLIDLSYLFSGLVFTILFNSKSGIGGKLFSGTLNNPSFSDLVTGGFWMTWGLLYKMLPMLLITALSGIASLAITGLIALGTGGIGGLAALAIGGISFAIIILIILLFITIQTIKFFIGAAKCYINLILRIIVAPIEIGLGAIPNSKMNFSSWIWNVIANLAVYPCSIIFIVLINMIIESIDGGLWSPPMFGLNYLLKAMVGLGAFAIVAKLPTMIPEFVFNIKPSPWGKAIGEGLQSLPGVKSVQQGVGIAKESGFKAAGTRIHEEFSLRRAANKAKAGSNTTGTGNNPTSAQP